MRLLSCRQSANYQTVVLSQLTSPPSPSLSLSLSLHQVACYDGDVVSEMDTEPKDLGAGHHTTQTLSFAETIGGGGVKDEQASGWSAGTTDMKFEYLLYGHRDQLACPICGKHFLDENRLR